MNATEARLNCGESVVVAETAAMKVRAKNAGGNGGLTTVRNAAGSEKRVVFAEE